MYKRMLAIASACTFAFLTIPHVPQVQAEKQEQPWRKYPDNAKMGFRDADTFYRSLDKQQYSEYPNAKKNIRKLATYKDVNAILSQASLNRVGGDGIHPNRQVYVYVSVSPQGEVKTAVFDAETKRQLSGSEGK
ncbi:hypothetical protein [Ectobacillus ponti]|uniref:DUF3862 domain-containing protein n=1 Tax=Ectobacillus ponti TaxID=2961894 RepID=A0AA41X492_9BACI|nr:hypothetical protein [Ectobacillus ponti]MCP8968432.1 hypothetical protein [Ectobacillus ponti]